MSSGSSLLDEESFEPLMPLAEMLVPDKRWMLFSRTLEGHHALIDSIKLNTAAPLNVRQQFENARNAWLYAFFAYRLLSVATLAVHVTCEAAVKERAKREGLNSRKSIKFNDLLDEAVNRRWLIDAGFASAAMRAQNWNAHRDMLLALGEPDIGPWQQPTDDQAHTREIVKAIRGIRNHMAHGNELTVPNLSRVFQAAADFINMLFPAKVDGETLASP